MIPNDLPIDLNFSKVFLDFTIISAIIIHVDKYAWRVGSLPRPGRGWLLLFFSKVAITSVVSPKQPRSRPLESVIYKLQILQLFCFDIHPNWWGWVPLATLQAQCWSLQMVS
jgi:hypothetical protein